jgi:precorrin-2 dehydrogenase/sirohydrochlorin ferrochelatase
MASRDAPTYPVHLRLEGVPVLVVGAGKVARRKVEGLLAAGTRVTVVAPEAVPELRRLAAARRIVWQGRPYRSPEARDYRLVFVATGVRPVAEQVARDAAAAGLFCNVADVPELCSFYLPAVVRREALTLTVISDGRAPFLSRRLRQRLERQYGPEVAAWAAVAADFRAAVRGAALDPAASESLFDRYLQETWPEGTASPRVPDETTWRGWIAAAGTEDATS